MSYRILNPTMTCGRCSHFKQYDNSPLGLCTEGAETLIYEGMPRGEYIVREYSSAELCKHFDESAESRIDNAPMPGWDERVDAAYKTKKEAA